MGSTMIVLGNGTTAQYNQSFQWSTLSMSPPSGNIDIVQSLGHRYVGNNLLMTNASYRLLTIYTASNTCITYRSCN